MLFAALPLLLLLPPQAGTRTFEQQTRTFLEKGRIPGLQITLVLDGEPGGSWAFGDGISRKTRFNAAALTRLVTAVTVARLAEQGRIHLGDRVEPLLPAPWLTNIQRPGITWKQLLSRTSGLADFLETGKAGFGRAWLGKEKTEAGFLDHPESLEKLLPQMLTKGEPAGYRHDSRDAFALLALLVERVAEKPFPEAVSETVLDPLGMDQSRLLRSSLPEDWPVAEGHGVPNEKGHIVPGAIWPRYEVCTLGDGALWTTAGDMAKFMTALLDKEGLGKGRLLSPESTRRLWTSTVEDEAEEGLGLGFVLRDGWAGIEGGNPGYFAEFWFQPDRRNGLVMLANMDSDSGRAFRAMKNIEKAVHKELARRVLLNKKKKIVPKLVPGG